MAKSSTAQALASLSHKFRAKIKEVGRLKAALDKRDVTASAIAMGDVYVVKLKERIAQLKQDNVDLTVHLNNVSVKAQNNAAALADAKASVSSWKSFSAVTFALGLGVGALGVLAYFQQIGL